MSNEDKTIEQLEIAEMTQNIKFQKEDHDRDVKQMIEQHKEDMRQNKVSFDLDLDQRKQSYQHDEKMLPLHVVELQQNVVREHLETLVKAKAACGDDKDLIKLINVKMKEMVEALNAV